MHRLACLVLLAGLTGCPPPHRYALIEVRGPQPVPQALVAADCGPDRAAQRTDGSGFARLRLWNTAQADRCTVTVARPGYGTVEARGVTLCTSATGCPALVVETHATGGALETQAMGGALETHATGGALETQAMGGELETHATGGALETHATGGALETHATGGALETHATGGAL